LKTNDLHAMCHGAYIVYVYTTRKYSSCEYIALCTAAKRRRVFQSHNCFALVMRVVILWNKIRTSLHKLPVLKEGIFLSYNGVQHNE
jgi:hypothetical protein